MDQAKGPCPYICLASRSGNLGVLRYVTFAPDPRYYPWQQFMGGLLNEVGRNWDYQVIVTS